MAQRRAVPDSGMNPDDVIERPSGGFQQGGPDRIGIPPGEHELPMEDHGVIDPGISPPRREGQGSESPRERDAFGTGVGGNATPRRPMAPTPMAGTASLQPFQPMSDAPAGMMAGAGMGAGSVLRRPGGGSLFGSMGGLKGGGLGMPLDPTNAAQNQDVSGLLQMLLKMKGGM